MMFKVGDRVEYRRACGVAYGVITRINYGFQHVITWFDLSSFDGVITLPWMFEDELSLSALSLLPEDAVTR